MDIQRDRCVDSKPEIQNIDGQMNILIDGETDRKINGQTDRYKGRTGMQTEKYT